ncbi:PAS domain-containing protein [Fulvivirgaceae bacterium PWU4]|uniref:PAS domain-containing protein n=1 Tax=Chryseosolibacter histidini TaxID=2782349 RepID=A0AAP2GH71_9BACT|nr:CheR family methyltransferase [Chryseosolibacter histidini]MBT1695739.1 PAS domain-containing protein [Chryseosolibacter histidini]
MKTNGNTSLTEAEHYIIAAGASAGGLEPIHELFDNMPDNTNFSFVIIQHLSPDHKSLMGELLAKHTSMKIVEAEDNMQLIPNCIHLIPSRKVMTLSNGLLKLHDKDRHQVPNNAIDIFFESLAVEKGKNAVGIILSGTGTDGTKGIEAIKKNGGLVIVQDPVTADFDGMPASAIQTGNVDLILPPELIAEEMIEYLKESPFAKTLGKFTKEEESVVQEILAQVKASTGHDFTLYKTPTITRRLAKRMTEKGYTNIRNYYEYLTQQPDEAPTLAKEFLINVTRFFRDTEAFEELRSKIIPSVFSSKKPHDLIKIWVVACSSGEEAYSIAIVLQEYMESIRNNDYNIKIFATDIDKDALQTASVGLYPESIATEVSHERLNKYFTREGNQYRILPSIRKMVVFAYHDIIKDPPFSKLDLITCRNMLIYMNNRLQIHVLKTFLFALNPSAHLMLGSSENIGVLKDAMKEVSKKWKIYKCVGKGRLVDNDHMMTPPASATIIQRNSNKPKNAASYMADIFKDTLLEESRYAGILIDENMEVKQAIGHFRDFLHFPENNLTFNLLKLVSPDLSVALGMSIRRAIHEQEKTVMRNVRIVDGNLERSVNILVKPYLQQQEYQQAFLFVIIQEQEKHKRIKRIPSRKKIEHDVQRIEDLEKELRETKENLQSVIEELESSNEELLTSNEEMISANEELQSTNEELQSLNEELHTVSSEHQLKIKELIELNDDLNNYFRNSEIGQILIDRNLIVRKFSPAIAQQINLIETDIGRPLVDITNNLQGVDLVGSIREVMRTNELREKEVSLANDKVFLMRITPYQRLDKTIDGVVVTFIDITEVKNLSGIIEGVFNSTTSAIAAKKAVRNERDEIVDFQYIAANRSAETLLGIKNGDSYKKNIVRLSAHDEQFFRRYAAVVNTGETDHFEFFNPVYNRWYEVVAVKMRDGLVTTFSDITQKKNAADLIAKNYEDLKETSSRLQETNFRLEQSNMDLLQFASVASHDLKEPLRKIQTFGNLLYSKIENKMEPAEKNYLDKIVNSSHRMQTLIEDVLTLSKLSNTDIPFAKTDLYAVVKHIVDDLEITIREKGTQIMLGKLSSVEAVPGQMHQLFQNLISNALKFNESERPVIRISERKVTAEEARQYNIDPADYLGICVEDNGIGFDDRYRDKIFGIFQRLHNNHYQGTGIGLAICKKIVDNHHGFIRAESREGYGATFIIVLPRQQKEKANNNSNGNGVHTEISSQKN